MTNTSKTADMQSANIIYDVTKEELTLELKEAIREFFVGVCQEEGDGLSLSLPNGQKFRINVERVD